MPHWAPCSAPGANGVYISTNAGMTWSPRNGTGLNQMPGAFGVGRISLAIAASSPQTLFAGLQNASTGQDYGTLLGLYKTTDGGTTWTNTGAPNYCATQCWYDNIVAVSPADPNIVL